MNNIIIVNKSYAIVLAYKNDKHDNTLEFINNNNNSQLLLHNPTDIYNK